MTFSKTLSVIALLTFSSYANAQTESKEDKLLRLAKYEDVLQVVKRYRALCLVEMKKMNPDSIAADNPEFFGDVMPGSKYWPEVHTIFQKYIESSCSYLNENNVLAKYVAIYSDLMSDRALDGILKFYESEAGSDYITAVTGGQELMQKYYAESASPVMKEALKKYTEELGAIVEKNRAEQSK